MADPTTNTLVSATTVVAAVVTAPVLTLFGIPLGLRADQLLAGFFGALAAIALLDRLPYANDSLQELIKTSFRRVGVALASAVTAGYIAPLVAILVNVPEAALLALCFVIGGAAQQVLRAVIGRVVHDVGAQK